MSITTSDLKFYYSVVTGAAGDSTAGTAGGSLGKFCSQTPVGSGAGAFFDDVSGSENAAMESEYRCFFLRNDHATLTATNVTVFMQSQVAGGADCAIALDNIAASAKGASAAQAAQIASEDVAPTGVGSFSTTAVDDASGLVVGSLAPGQVKAIWVKRTTTNSAALDNDGLTLGYDFDTAE